MDQKNIGAFMQELRKEKGLTQKELADKICVSDKTISKWENGYSMPDISILMNLCQELGISVNELLSCERIPPEDYSKKAEVTIMNLIQENQENKKSKKLQYLLGFFFLALPFFMVFIRLGRKPNWYIDLPSFLLLASGCIAVTLLSGKQTKTEIVHILRKIVIPMGALIDFLDTVAMQRELTDPSSIGPCVSLLMIMMIYSIIAYFIFFLLEQHWNVQ